MTMGARSSYTALIILAFTIIHSSGLTGCNDLRYDAETPLDLKDLASSVLEPRKDTVFDKKWVNDGSLRRLRELRSTTNWAKLRGWWWSGFVDELEVPSQNRTATALLHLPSDSKVGDRYVARCVFHRSSHTFRLNDGFRRVKPDDLNNRDNGSFVNVSCGSRGALEAAEVSALEDLHHRKLAHERALVRASRERAVEHAKAIKAVPNATQPIPSRFLSIVGSVSGTCLDKGLTHKLNNLELELQLS